jgi:hypothetical protein
VANHIAEIEIINHAPGVRSVAKSNTQPIPLVTVKQKDHKFNNTLFVHCKHEARLEGVKRHLHEIHDHIFKETDFGDIKLIVDNRNNPDIYRL